VVRIEERPDSKSGYIDHSGTLVIRPAFIEAGPFSEGRAAVETSARVVGNQVVDITWGFIDKSGALVIPAKYQFAGNFSEGLARVAIRLGESMGYVDRDGKMVISLVYQQAGDFSDGLATVVKEQWMYIDRSGKQVLKGRGGHWPFSDGLAVIGLPPGPQLYIDKRGRVVAPYEK
jgi:hypothetical protein